MYCHFVKQVLQAHPVLESTLWTVQPFEDRVVRAIQIIFFSEQNVSDRSTRETEGIFQSLCLKELFVSNEFILGRFHCICWMSRTLIHPRAHTCGLPLQVQVDDQIVLESVKSTGQFLHVGQKPMGQQSVYHQR